MKTCDELKHIHEAAMNCLSHLHHFAMLLEHWDHLGTSAEYMDSRLQGMRRAVAGLVADFARRPAVASPGRQAMIRGARAANTAPACLCNQNAACMHDAVFMVTNQVVNWVASAVGWQGWTQSGPDQPAPESVSLEQLDPQSAAEIVNLFREIRPLCSDDESNLAADTFEKTRPRLEIEFVAAKSIEQQQSQNSAERPDVTIPPEKLSRHYKPRDLAAAFVMSWDKLKKMLDTGAIPHVKHSSKDYQIHVDYLPEKRR